jgi:hypothetical protein
VLIENSSWITFYLKNHSRSKTDFFSKSGGVFISVQSEIEPSFPDRPVLADLRDSRMTKFDRGCVKTQKSRRRWFDVAKY